MLSSDKRLLIAAAPRPDGSRSDICLKARMINRHGLITGATGTGKTVTLQNMAETLSDLGVPVLVTDVKGDLSGLAAPGRPTGGLAARVADLALADQGYVNHACPVCFWDVAGQRGHQLRVTVSDMGPLLMARLLDLNEVQSGILNIAFRVADDQGLLLLDFKDLRAMLNFLQENRDDFKEYGHMAPASLGAIQRALLQLEGEGGDGLFGEPSLNMEDLLRTDAEGRGVVNILVADRLMLQPHTYAALLLWLLSEIYESLPEVGDREMPRLVLMFDEAHLLFDETPPALMDKIEQVARLVRSKGVGLYFITQSPADVPETILAQLGNRVQHALRAYTPRERKAVRAAAQSFRPNPAIDTEEAIGSLATGEALISFLNDKGEPQMVERGLVLPPQSLVGPLDDASRAAIIKASPLAGRYDTTIDRESAYELLMARVAEQKRTEEALAWQKDRERLLQEQQKREREALRFQREQAREAQRLAREQERAEKARLKAERENDIFGNIVDNVVRSATRSVTSSVSRNLGKTVVRGILGSLFKS